MSSRRPNRLAASTSPYLLQHAHNPVDWWPWGPEAFAEARRRDVPIFLSIGYSTCYWCHVMERESFENEELGKLLSDAFVCIKVDREERPDVDDLYMQATLAVRGQGGWPMSVFLEPEKLRPFWCATYIPPATRGQMAGLPQIIAGISSAWKEQRKDVIEQAGQIAEAVREHLASTPAPVALSPGHVGAAVEQLLRMFDRQHGGFGAAPKFPQPVFLELLLACRASVDTQSRGAIDLALRHTLDKMAIGGLFDHLAGGFHRYSVDATWTVPHFEKMLYDNALLAGVYARAASDLADPFYATVAARTIEYMRRELGLASGGFASAQDAEVDGREGLNYVWTPEQIREALPAADADFALSTYGLSRGPNFQDPHHPKDPPTNVLRFDHRPDRLAERSGSAPAFTQHLGEVSAKLLAARDRRKQPRLDDKAIASWNGLAIAALAQASTALKRDDWRHTAERAATMIVESMVAGGGLLLRCSRSGTAHTPGVLEDYAFLARGLLALDAATGGSSRWLAETTRLVATARRLFRDDTGAWFDTPADQPDLFVRGRSTHDGALPSGGSVMLHVLLDLHQRTGVHAWLEDALALLSSLSGQIAGGPVGATTAVAALLRVLTDPAARPAALAAGTITDSPDAAPPPAASIGAMPVEIYAGVDSIRVGDDEPAEFTLLVRIPPALHVPAADPGAVGRGLTPFRALVAGGRGITVYADYPPGEPYAAPGQQDSIRVYRGEFELRIAVERAGDWSGTPSIAVQYQACTDTECLAPTTVELDVTIERAS